MQTDRLAGKDPWSKLPGASTMGRSGGQREGETEKQRVREGDRERGERLINSLSMCPAVGSYT